MRTSLPCPAARHRGGTLIPHPYFCVRDLDLSCRGRETWPCKPSRLVGRAEEIGSLDQVLAELDQGQLGCARCWSVSRASARHGCWPSSPLARTRGGSSSSQAPRRSSSATCRSRSSSMRSTSTCAGIEPSRLGALDDDVRTELAHVFPSLTALAAAARRRRSSTSAIAATVRCARCSSSSRRTQPLVLVLDDLHWADSASVELLGALLRRPPAAGCCSRWPCGRARCPSDCRPRSSGRTRAEMLDAHRARGAERRGGARATRRRGERAERTSSTTRAAATPSISSSSPALGGRRSGGARRGVAGRRSGSRERRRGAHGRARPAVRPARLVLEGAAVAGDPFEPELAAAAAALAEAALMEAIDELLRLDLLRPTDVPRRFRFRHPLVRRAVYEATAGGWRLGAHERCADALAARGARRRARPPRRALGARGRRRRRGRPSRGRRGSGAAGAGKRGALVRRGTAPAPADAPARSAIELLLARARAHGGRAFRRQPRDLLEALDRARRRRRAASHGSPALRRSGDDSRAARASRCASVQAHSRSCPTGLAARPWRS